MNRRLFLKNAGITMGMALIPISVLAKTIKPLTDKEKLARIPTFKPRITDIESLNRRLKLDFDVHDIAKIAQHPAETAIPIMSGGKKLTISKSLWGDKVIHKEMGGYIENPNKDTEAKLCQAAYKAITKEANKAGSKQILVRVWPEIKEFDYSKELAFIRNVPLVEPAMPRMSMYWRISFLPPEANLKMGLISKKS
jgi:hypothetical protein